MDYIYKIEKFFPEMRQARVLYTPTLDGLSEIRRFVQFKSSDILADDVTALKAEIEFHAPVTEWQEQLAVINHDTTQLIATLSEETTASVPPVEPEYDPMVERIDETATPVWDDNLKVYVKVTRPLTQEELNVLLEQRVDDINSAANQYIFRRLNSDGMLLLERLKNLPEPSAKGAAIEQWLTDIRKDQFTRVAILRAGGEYSNQLLDFSAHGDKPYQMTEVMTDAGLL